MSSAAAVQAIQGLGLNGGHPVSLALLRGLAHFPFAHVAQHAVGLLLAELLKGGAQRVSGPTLFDFCDKPRKACVIRRSSIEQILVHRILPMDA